MAEPCICFNEDDPTQLCEGTATHLVNQNGREIGKLCEAHAALMNAIGLGDDVTEMQEELVH